MAINKCISKWACLFVWTLAAVGCQQEEIAPAESEEMAEVDFSVAMKDAVWDTETDYIPMTSRADGTGYFNFSLVCGELVIYRNLGDNMFQVEKVLSTLESHSLSVENGTSLSLEDFGFTETSVVLREGDYVATLMLNGPVRIPTLKAGNIVGKAESVIGDLDYFMSSTPVRDLYYAAVPFKVKKSQSLSGNQNTDTEKILFEPERYAAPIRLILESEHTILSMQNRASIECSVESEGIPQGLDLMGNLGGKSSVKVSRTVTLPFKWNNATSVRFLPDYMDENPTSVFVPVDEGEGCTVTLYISKIVHQFASIEVNAKVPVSVKRGYITNVILKLSESETLTYTVEDEDIKSVAGEWESDFSQVPFEYIEYNRDNINQDE